MNHFSRALLFLISILAGVTLHAQVVANFTASPTSGCAPLLVSFTSTSTGNVTGYSWTFGNSGTSVLQNPSTTYTTYGVYPVTLTVTGANGQKSSKTINITVYQAPTVNFSFTNSAGCAPHTSTFTSSVTPNAPGGVTYSWNFGDGFTDNKANTTHTYNTGNTYTVTLIATNGQGCSSTATQTSIITVYPKPSGTFSAYPNTFCNVPAIAVFTANTSGSTPIGITWSFGDGGGGSGPNITHVYTNPGTYTVKMYMTDSKGCRDSVIQQNYISVRLPSATFTAPQHICQSNDTVLSYPATITDPSHPVIQRRHGTQAFGTFTNTTSGASGSTTFWDFGDGLQSTGMTVQHAYKSAGTFQVKMVTDMGGCYDTVIKTVIVHPPPNMSLSYDTLNCPAPVGVKFNASGATSYQWTWGNGVTSTSSNPTVTYNHDGFMDSVILVGTDAFGCKDTILTGAIILDMFPKYLGPIRGCAPADIDVSFILGSSVTGDGKYPARATITSYYWDFGDGTYSTLASPTHTYTKPGIYNRILTITTSNGCTLKDTVEIHIGSPVTPSFTFHPDTVCVKQTVYFNNTTPNPPSAVLKYDWEVGQGYSMINGRDAVTGYIRPGIYDIILRVDSNGCVDSTICYACVVVHPSDAQFVDSVYCGPNYTTVLFGNTSTGPTNVLWDFGDGTGSTQYSPVHTYAAGGTYNVRLTTYNSVYGCRDTLFQTVDARVPQLDFAAPDTTLCLGQTLTLNPTYVGPNKKIIGYQWLIDGKNPVGDTIVAPVNYLMAPWPPPPPPFKWNGIDTPILGRHDVTYLVYRRNRNDICIDSLRKHNYFIVSKPTPKFDGGPATGCTPLTVTYHDSSAFTPGTGPGTRFWVFGNGDTMTASGTTVPYVYYKAGIYNVMLKITDWNGCADSLIKPSLIEAKHPSAIYVPGKQNACAWSPINFTNMSQPPGTLTFRWDFGDGDTSNALHPQHYYKKPGTYTVSLAVTDATGCSDTFTRANVITISRPTADFTMSDSISVCPPLSVKFLSTSTGAVSYDWNFGNTNVAYIPAPSCTYTASGLYPARLVVADVNGCTDTMIKPVRVLGYAGALSYSPLKGCAPLEVLFTSTVTNVPLAIWDFSDGYTDTVVGANSTHVYMTPGKYLPKLIFSNGPKCASSSDGLDTIRVDGIIAAFKAVAPCEKSMVQFVDTSYSYFSPLSTSRWDFGGAGAATGNPVSRMYSSAGTYPITLISTNANGCKDTLVSTVTIYPLPHVVAPPDTTICVPDAIQLFASGAKTYVWSPATGLSCTNCSEPMASPSGVTDYIVLGTDSNGCMNKDTVHIGMQTKSTFVTVKDGEICLGQSYQLLAGGATVYSWTPVSSLNNPNIPNPKASPTTNTTYIVTGWEGSCLPDTHKVNVIVRPLPTVDAGGDLKVVAGNPVLLQATGVGIVRVTWDEDPTLSCTTCFAPEARPKVSTTYHITAYNEYGCAATDSVRVQVICDGSQLFIPNSFTPNGDGKNDFFFARGQGLDHINAFRVYSRWGELLFEKTNMALNDEYAGWNGTFNGRKLNPDVYVYIIEATCDTGEPIRFKGDVTLLR
jgi:gliding motility-associated-like protein